MRKEGSQSQSITCCRTAGAERKNCRMGDKATQEGQVKNRSKAIKESFTEESEIWGNTLVCFLDERLNRLVKDGVRQQLDPRVFLPGKADQLLAVSSIYFSTVHI